MIVEKDFTEIEPIYPSREMIDNMIQSGVEICFDMKYKMAKFKGVQIKNAYREELKNVMTQQHDSLH